MTDWYTVSVAVFCVFLAAIMWLDRKNVKRDSILLMRKTQRGKRLIMKLGALAPGPLKALGVFAVIVGFAVSAFFLFYLGQTAYSMAVAEKPPAASVGLLLPSPSSEPFMVPGVIGAPFWYWIISIALLIVFHEGMHGLMAAREKLKIKSLGWGVLAFIPLAFVEPDEKELQRRPAWQQLRVFAAGSFGNFILAAICLAALYAFMVSFYVPGGVAFSGYTPGYPAERANLTGIIVGMDFCDAGGGCYNWSISDVAVLRAALDSAGPGRDVIVHTRVYYKNYTFEERSYHMVTAGNGTSAMLGINYNPQAANFMSLADGLWGWKEAIRFFEGLFEWMFVINLGVGAVNLLPIGPLDGGRMWQLLFRRISKKRWKSMETLVTNLTLALLILNFAIPILRMYTG